MPCTVVKIPGGGTAIVKHAKPRRRCCGFCRLTWDGFLCDHEIGPGKTCDAPMCKQHAAEMAPDFHLCPNHYTPPKEAA